MNWLEAVRAARRLALALCAGLGLGLLQGIAAPAMAFDLDELQQLLEAGSRQEVRFHETRESPWLAAPVESRGTLAKRPDGSLEKRIVAPRLETWRLEADRLERIGPNDELVGTVSYEKFPALGAMARAMREGIAGNFAAMTDEFEPRLQGTAERWTLALLPRAPAASRHVERVELQGDAAGLRVLVVVERDGARTRTHLLD